MGCGRACGPPTRAFIVTNMVWLWLCGPRLYSESYHPEAHPSLLASRCKDSMAVHAQKCTDRRAGTPHEDGYDDLPRGYS